MTISVAIGSAGADFAPEERQQRFRAFVGSHRERAVRLASRLLGGDLAAAEDVAQEAFVRAWRALPRFREEASLGTWFYRILVREAQRYRRWRAVRTLWADDPSEVADTRGAGDGDPSLRRRILESLEALPARQRQVFVLVHLEGFTVTEAAAVLGRSPGTLKSHLHRALVALRRSLADLSGEDEGAPTPSSQEATP